MDKINGYSEQEARALIDFIAEGKKRGEALSALFASYGKKCGRAAGSVRNYYYQFLKCEDARAKEILRGKRLRAEKIRAFSDEERNEMLKKILSERSKGYSVRRAIANVCAGNEKQMLRYQNKYRNLAKKQPELIERTAKEMGLPAAMPARKTDFLQKRLEREINDLYDRLAVALREENDRLKKAVERLTEENEILRRAGKTEKGA
ncbi:MAG TPA: hypothetical protein H9727_03370 [Candidatus Borkfalkia avistercoris]|uniref:Uncharacterized protein n=1 Tax=Candidatus Borkfalkia avistercoris TaxID=2838504 RepID=A0A9D2ID68_9FIRM|nr:hypothetical protein [Candidatus Borkfalkia avistercoris]